MFLRIRSQKKQTQKPKIPQLSKRIFLPSPENLSKKVLLCQVMNRPLTALLSKLSYGEVNSHLTSEASNGFVETLARVYERARNALEYRADNLVRRAAIERILKRIMLLTHDPGEITEHLLTELRWAKYISSAEMKSATQDTLKKILTKYVSYKGIVPHEWLVKIASAEIEEIFNLNIDYKQFTFYAFQVIRQKVQIQDENLDLLIYYATDKIYAGSDDEQVAYHILGLAGTDVTREKFEEAWKLFNTAKSSKILSKIYKFVRRQMPPMVLLRDIYFYEPSKFKELLKNREKFDVQASEVLTTQLEQMSGKISTAGIRSVIYVFLTKMILAFGVEVPFEIFWLGHLNTLPLALNMIFPPVLMWLTTTQIKLPSKKEQTALIERTWYVLDHFDFLSSEEDVLRNSGEESHGSLYWIFTILYTALFIGIFWIIYYLLGRIGYTLFSELIFIFFLTVIAFFAYRISQIAKVYSWKPIKSGATFMEIVSLPILAIGSRLSQGLSHLNFLAFAFDFILEAPFKIILGFVDDWVQFLSAKREEQIIE